MVVNWEKFEQRVNDKAKKRASRRDAEERDMSFSFGEKVPKGG